MFSFSVSGGDEIARRLERMPEALTKTIVGAALKAGGEPIRRNAEALMHRGAEAPHAADHVRMQLGKTGHSLAIGPTKDFFYWLFQEFGTVRHPATPAMRPAFDTYSVPALGIVGQHLWAAIRAQAGGESDAGSIGGRFL